VIKEEIQELISIAFDARKKAYSPYSGFQVGAALKAKTGYIFTGCNIENASYGVTNCAERTAVFKAVSEGVTEFEAIAIVGAPKDLEPMDYAYPCGICRQVLQEFCGDDFSVIVAKNTQDYKIYPLSELMPFGFSKEQLK